MSLSPKAMSILEMAQALLTGSVAKAEPAETDPDAMNSDGRTAEGAPSPEALAAARAEAQAGQQAAAAQGGEGGEGGDGGAPGAPDTTGGEPGAAAPGAAPAGAPAAEPDGDDTPVAKAEILASMAFLAEHNGITPEEIVKAFSGTEGNPALGKAPVGEGVELLQKIAENQGNASLILDRIAAFLAELTKHTVSLQGEVAKSLEASAAATASADATKKALDDAVRSAPAAPAKAATEIGKSQDAGAGGEKPLTGNDLFKLALAGKLDPLEAAAANRRVNYLLPVGR